MHAVCACVCGSSIDLSRNNLAGAVPAAWTSWSYVDFSDNNLSGVVTDVAAGTSLATAHLNVSHNNITAPAPVAAFLLMFGDHQPVPAVIDTSYTCVNVTADGMYYKLQPLCANTRNAECVFVPLNSAAYCHGAPLVPPLPPVDVTASPQLHGASVMWAPGGGGSGPAADNYTVFAQCATNASGSAGDACCPSSQQGLVTVIAPLTSATVAPLCVNHSYVFAVLASNAVGSAQSAWSKVPVTPCSSGVSPPGPPQSVTGTAVVHAVTCGWVPAPFSGCWDGNVSHWNVSWTVYDTGVGSRVSGYQVLQAASVSWTVTVPASCNAHSWDCAAPGPRACLWCAASGRRRAADVDSP